MVIISILLMLIGISTFIVGLVLILPKSKRRLGKRLAVGGPITFVTGVGLSVWAMNEEAKTAGFEGYGDRNAARVAGFTDANLWRAKREADRTAELTRQAEIEKHQLEETRACPQLSQMI